MAVDDLWYKDGPDGKRVPSSRHGRGKRYRVRYTGPDGNVHQPLFERKIDATTFDATIRADIARGEYVDPRAGRVTFQECAEHWRSVQVHADSTQAQIETHFRRHVYPYLGARPMKAIRPSDVRGMVKHLEAALAPATIEVVYRYVVAVFRSAVGDGIIPASPCVNIGRPAIAKKRLEPLPVDAVAQLREAIPPRYRALNDLGVLAGLRQGEGFGLEVEHIDFLRRTVRVVQQLKYLAGQPPFLCPPKTETSHRTIPVGRVFIDRLAAHLAEFPPVPVSIVDKTAPRPVERVVRLVVTTAKGQPWPRPRYSERVWRPAVARLGLTGPGEPTFHDLRHFYASALISGGASVTTVQHRLGHATAAETLGTYSHLWPGEDDKTRGVIDGLFLPEAVGLRAVP